MTISSLLCLSLLFPLAEATEFVAEPVVVRGVESHELAPLPTVKESREVATPQHIIYMIGDGMGVEQIAAAAVANGGSLNMLQLPQAAFVKSNSANAVVTDSPAGGTALACGQKTNNGLIGIDTEGKPLRSLLQEAAEQGFVTGLIVTKSITDATPATFYAHVKSRKETAAIMADLMKTPIDIIVGGGRGNFTEAQRAALAHRTTLLEWLGEKDADPAAKRGPVLEQSTARALDKLTQAAATGKRSFVMIEGSQIDVAGHDMDAAYLVDEMLDFDRTVGVVLRWMEKNPNTLLVITADHATGGLALVGGNMAKGEVRLSYALNYHNGLLVPLMAHGPYAGLFHGCMDNTEVANKLRELILRTETAK